jgi:hypothetical protein
VNRNRDANFFIHVLIENDLDEALLGKPLFRDLPIVIRERRRGYTEDDLVVMGPRDDQENNKKTYTEKFNNVVKILQYNDGILPSWKGYMSYMTMDHDDEYSGRAEECLLLQDELPSVNADQAFMEEYFPEIHVDTLASENIIRPSARMKRRTQRMGLCVLL